MNKIEGGFIGMNSKPGGAAFSLRIHRNLRRCTEFRTRPRRSRFRIPNENQLSMSAAIVRYAKYTPETQPARTPIQKREHIVNHDVPVWRKMYFIIAKIRTSDTPSTAPPMKPPTRKMK